MAVPVFLTSLLIEDGVGNSHEVWVAFCPARIYDTVVGSSTREGAMLKLAERMGEMPDPEGVVAALDKFVIAETK